MSDQHFASSCLGLPACGPQLAWERARQREQLDPQEAQLTSKEQPPQPPSPTQPVVDRNGRMTAA
jgi:hypothetical protein